VVFACLEAPSLGRWTAETLIRRVFGQLLDGGQVP